MSVMRAEDTVSNVLISKKITTNTQFANNHIPSTHNEMKRNKMKRDNFIKCFVLMRTSCPIRLRVFGFKSIVECYVDCY